MFNSAPVPLQSRHFFGAMREQRARIVAEERGISELQAYRLLRDGERLFR